MDFMKLIALMFIKLLHTSHQVNDHPEGMNNLLDKLIKDTESHFAYNNTTIMNEKNNKNLNDSKIVYVKTQVDPDILFQSNVTQKSSEEKPHLEDRRLLNNENDEIKTKTKNEDAKIDVSNNEHMASSRRAYDRIHSNEYYSEIIEENMANIEEDDDMIYEKEITYDITENTQNHSNPKYQLSSLIDAVTRSGSRIDEDVIDRMADMAEDAKYRDPQASGEKIYKSDVVKVLNNYNILNGFDKSKQENNSNSDIQQLLSFLISKLINDSETSQQPQLEHSESFIKPPIHGSDYEEIFSQIVTNENLKSILESIKVDEPQHSKKSDKNVLPEMDIRKVEENLKILDEWDKRYNIFHRFELHKNSTESKQQPQYNRQEHKEHENDDLYRSGFANIPEVQHRPIQPPKAHLIPQLSNPRLIFPIKNKIKCCSHTKVIGNPLLGIYPTERLGLINSVNRMTSGFVYNPLYYPY